MGTERDCATRVWEEEEEELLLVLLVLMAVAQRSRLDLGCRKRAPLMELLVTAELFLCSARLTPGLHGLRHGVMRICISIYLFHLPPPL